MAGRQVASLICYQG